MKVGTNVRQNFKKTKTAVAAPAVVAAPSKIAAQLTLVQALTEALFPMVEGTSIAVAVEVRSDGTIASTFSNGRHGSHTIYTFPGDVEGVWRAAVHLGGYMDAAREVQS